MQLLTITAFACSIMSVYGLTTQRYFGPQVDLAPYKNILRWLQDCSQRDGYKKAMQAGDPEMKPLLDAEPPSKSFFPDGVKNNHCTYCIALHIAKECDLLTSHQRCREAMSRRCRACWF